MNDNELTRILDAFASLGTSMKDILKPMYEKKEVKHFNNDPVKLNKTRKGAHHKHNKTFLSRQVMPMTPAQYRRQHLGATKKKVV